MIAERCQRARINSAIFVSSEGKGFDSIEFIRRYGSQSVLCRKAKSAENITAEERNVSSISSRSIRGNHLQIISFSSRGVFQKTKSLKARRRKAGRSARTSSSWSVITSHPKPAPIPKKCRNSALYPPYQFPVPLRHTKRSSCRIHSMSSL